jgi:hypothetical protein
LTKSKDKWPFLRSGYRLAATVAFQQLSDWPTILPSHVGRSEDRWNYHRIAIYIIFNLVTHRRD